MTSSELSKEEAERRARRIQGIMYGFLLGVASRTFSDTGFDPEDWEALYSEDVIHDSYPVYPSRKDAKQDTRRHIVTDWDNERRQSYLPNGARLPTDRHGLILFENQTAAYTNGGNRHLLDLKEHEYNYLKDLSKTRIDLVREGYNWSGVP